MFVLEFLGGVGGSLFFCFFKFLEVVCIFRFIGFFFVFIVSYCGLSCFYVVVFFVLFSNFFFVFKDFYDDIGYFS